MEYFLRFLLCLLKWTLIVVVVASLCVGAFTYAMDYANISVLVSDGMKTRAGVVLGYTQADELPKFFSQEYLSRDTLLQETVYLDYTINSYDAQEEVSALHTLPWEKTASVVVSESVTIDGELPISKQTAEQLNDPNKIPPPDWRNGTYAMTLQKTEDGWIITDVQPAAAGEETSAD